MMRYMKRDITQELLAWKEQPNRKPLVLKGVRQCGKTYILKEFGREYYKDVAYFNFEENRSLNSLFEQDYDVKRILFDLGLFLGRTITPGNTLIILDEIQECPRAITALKYFCENAPEYHVACAGSLLGLAIHENQSFPVGKVDIRTLYPMSFYEFLSATGNEALADYLTRFKPGSSVSELIGGKAPHGAEAVLCSRRDAGSGLCLVRDGGSGKGRGRPAGYPRKLRAGFCQACPSQRVPQALRDLGVRAAAAGQVQQQVHFQSCEKGLALQGSGGRAAMADPGWIGVSSL